MVKTRIKTSVVLLTLLLVNVFVYAQVNHQWGETMRNGFSSSIRGPKICSDPNGNIYATGAFWSGNILVVGLGTSNETYLNATAGFGGSQSDVYVTKYNSDGVLQWAYRIGDIYSDEGTDIVADQNGNVYVTGFVTDRIVDLNPIDGPGNFYNSPNYGGKDIFLIKLNTNGGFVWAKRFGSSANEQGLKLALDSIGDVYLAGEFSGSFVMSSGASLNLVGSQDVFLAKVSRFSGSPFWAISFDGGINVSSYLGDIALENGHVFIAWNGSPINYQYSGSRTRIDKIDLNGNIILRQNLPATSSGNSGTQLIVTSNSEVIVAGPAFSSYNFNPNIWPDNTLITPGGERSIYMLKLDSSLEYLWAKQICSSLFTTTGELSKDNLDNVYLTGAFQDTIDLDPSPTIANYNSAGGRDIFVAKYDDNGSYQWAYSLGIVGNEAAEDMLILNDTSFLHTGTFDGQGLDLDPSSSSYIAQTGGQTNPNAKYAFISKLEQCITKTDSITVSACSQYVSPSGNYTWTASGTFKDTLTASSGCDSIVTVALTIYQPSATSLSEEICGTSFTLNSQTYTTSGIYTQVLTNSVGCDSTITLALTLNPPVVAGITPSGTFGVCNGVNFQLRASGGTTYAWSNGGGSNASAIFTATVSTTYTVTVSDANGCSASTSSQVIVNQPPTASILPATAEICRGASVTLTGTGGSSYAWSNGLGTGSSKTVSPTTTTTYTVTVTDANGCSASASRLVTVNALPTASISPASATICSGTSQSLTASGGNSYVWSNGLGSGATRSVSPLSATTYTVTVTNANNCTATASSTISVNPTTVITTEPISQSTCTGSNVTFTVVASGVGLSYQWRKGAANVGTNSASLSIPSVALSDAGNYSVIVSGTCGSDTSAVAALTVVTSASISQQPVAQTVCVGSPISLSVTGSGGNNTTYLWYKGNTSLATQTSATLSIPSATVSDAGNYYVVVSGSCGTINSDTVAVTVNSLPSAAINPATATICAGESQTLTASGGGTYTWSNSGGSNAAANFSPSGNTTYTVTVTNNGCSATATATVNVTALPVAVISPAGAVAVCAGNSTTLTASGGGSYIWSNSGGSSAAATFSPTGTTTYTVTVTANNCSATASKQVTVNALPNISISPASAAICPGGSQLLTASGASTYTWSNGLGTGSSKTVSPVSNTTYSVTATDANSCTATASATITVGVSTDINTQPIAQTTCVGGNVSFSVAATGTGLSYNWRKDGVSLGAPNSATYNIASAVLADAGNYDVIVSGDCGADTSSLAALTVTGSLQISQQPQPVTECAGSNAILTVVANGANISYTWTRNGNPVANSNNDTLFLNNLSAADAGNYVCNITSSCGNATSSAALVTVNASTTGSISETVCFGESFVFNGQTLSASGTYFDTLMNAAGCDSIVTLNFTVSPRIDTILNEVLCNGSSLTFNGQTISSAGQYLDTLLSAASCDSFITLNVTIALATSSSLTESACGSFSFGGESLFSTGTYFDTIMNAAGCDSLITLDLTILPNSSSNIADTICAGTNYNFGGQVLTQTGIYTDTIMDGLGCDSVISLALFVRPAFSVSVTQAGAVLVADAGFADYQWQLNGIDIANANSDTYTTTESGDYTVVVTDSNNCQATSELATITGVGFTNANMGTYIKLYPNPAKDHLTIECSETIVGYEVRNLLGEVVLQSYSYSGPIDINELAASAYIIVVNTTKGTSISKFFKER